MAYNYSNDYGSYDTKKWADLLNQTNNQTSNRETANQQTSDQTSNQQTSNQQTSNQTSAYSQAFTDFSGIDSIDEMNNCGQNYQQNYQQNNYQQNRQSQKTTPPDQV
jgi:hypothetical protein